MKAYILIGLIGSGKSSWARMVARIDSNVIRVGVDDIRSMIKDRYTFDFQLEPLVDKMKMAMIREVIAAGKDVVIDDIHLTKKGRLELCESLVNMARTGIEIIYVWIHCNHDTALDRRLTNLRGASEFEWRQVMRKHEDLFEVPIEDENEYANAKTKMMEISNE